MLHRLGRRVLGCAVLASCWSIAPAIAQDATPVPPAVQASAQLPGLFGTKVVDSALLAKQRGGSDSQVLSDLKLNGVVSDNRASNLTTGNNVISDGAFSGVSGVPLVVQNSGNNVLIQSATIINVQVK